MGEERAGSALASGHILLCPVDHFLQEVCSPWGVMSSCTRGPTRFPPSPAPGASWDSVLQPRPSGPCWQSCRFPSRPSPPRLSPSRVRNPSQNLKTQSFLPEKKELQVCVRSQGIPQVLIEGYESRLTTPGINHTQVTLKPGSFSYCSLYYGLSVSCVIPLIAYFWNPGAQNWISRSLRFISCSSLVHAGLSSVTPSSVQFAALGWRPSLTIFYDFEWVT